MSSNGATAPTTAVSGSASGDWAIRVENLSKVYRIEHASEKATSLAEAVMRTLRHPIRRNKPAAEEFWALRDVSFDVGHGEVVGIVGRNGAGKSTLLKILSRITPPSAGYADLNGRVGSLLEVGTGFHRELTGRENIYLNGAVLGMRRREIERQFDAIVDFAGVEKFLDTPVKHYSSGMYVRLAFAVAAHLEPEILIVDEVLAVGDAEFQRKCLGKMKDVAKSGRTILFVSHNMRTVAAICSRVILMQGGRVAADGDPEEVIPKMTALGGSDGDSADRAQRRFAPDETKAAQVLAVTVRNARGEPSLRHDLLEPITLEVEFELRRDLPSLIVSSQVRTPQEDIVFVSTDADWPNHQSRTPSRLFPKSAGRYTARVTLPAPLLNLGRYELVLNLIQAGDLLVDSVRGIDLEITDVVSFASCLNQRPRSGYIAVPVPWTVTEA